MLFEASVEIAAPPETVWAVMSDVERWHEWTASIASIRLLDGALTVGSRVRIRQPKLPATVWRVSVLEPGRYFEWQAESFGSVVVAGHRVEPAPGGSRATVWIDQGGLLGSLFGRVFKNLTLQYLDVESQGLKRRSESPA